MLDIGRHIDSVRSDDEEETILGVINDVDRNKLYLNTVGHWGLIISNPNEYKRLKIIPFKMWRVIALGMFWSNASTANEDPVVDFGTSISHLHFGRMTAAITGGEKFTGGDHQKYDPLNLLAPEKIAETSPTLVTTWTPGPKFNVWQNAPLDVIVVEAAAVDMTSGILRPYMLIEVKTGGMW